MEQGTPWGICSNLKSILKDIFFKEEKQVEPKIAKINLDGQVSIDRL